MNLRPLALSLTLLAAAGLAPHGASAAPREVHVLQFASGRAHVDATIRLTKALEQQALNAADTKLINSNRSLLEALRAAKCGQPFVHQSLRSTTGPLGSSGQLLDEPCLSKVAVSLEAPYGKAERFFWGYIYTEPGGAVQATAHLWQRGQPDRHLTLPYRGSVDRVAERLFLHLWRGNEVGDLRLMAERPFEGELVVNGQPRGRFDPNDAELTAPVGEVEALVRAEDGKVLAKGRTTVGAEGVATLRLEPVVEAPLVVAAQARQADVVHEFPSTPTPARSKGSSTLPWVFGGVGVAGLAGAGIFFAMRQGKVSDLEEGCRDDVCLPDQKKAIDRGNLYGTLSLVSLGVGVAGAGVATYLFLRPNDKNEAASRGRYVAGGLQPLAGGGSLYLTGRF